MLNLLENVKNKIHYFHQQIFHHNIYHIFLNLLWECH